MLLKLMYITNHPEVARIAEENGVDRIFVDMECIGKSERQGGMDTVQSSHTLEDVKRVRAVVSKAELLVRCNPIHDATTTYTSSEEEIESIIGLGADIIMLPYFKTVEEVERFLAIVNGRVKTMLLVETAEAVACLDEILTLKGVDEIFVGLNDLSLSYDKSFMFELLADGTVEFVAEKCKEKDIPFGFGGIASLGKGLLPAEHVIGEHYRLGSSSVILSRSFKDLKGVTDLDIIRNAFSTGIEEIRMAERYYKVQEEYKLKENRRIVCERVKEIVEE